MAPPELSGSTLTGETWRLADQRGRVVLLNFWAGWCPSCLEELPALNRLAERLAGRPVTMVGINVGEPDLRARTLSTQYAIGFPVLLDPDQVAFIRWGATGLPTTYLMDARGRMRLVGRGPLDWDDPAVSAPLDRLIDEAAAGAPAAGSDTVRPVRSAGSCGTGCVR